MTDTIERKYALTRLAEGDYLLPSNDTKTIWRIVRYQDGRALGLDVSYDYRDFWRAESLPMDEYARWAENEPDLRYYQLPWRERASHLRTRKEAIAIAMSTESP